MSTPPLFEVSWLCKEKQLTRTPPRLFMAFTLRLATRQNREAQRSLICICDV